MLVLLDQPSDQVQGLHIVVYEQASLEECPLRQSPKGREPQQKGAIRMPLGLSVLSFKITL